MIVELSSLAADFVPGPDWLKYGFIGLVGVVVISLIWKIDTKATMGLFTVVGAVVVLTVLAVVLSSSNERDSKVKGLEKDVSRCQADIRTTQELLTAKAGEATDLATSKAIAKQAAALLKNSPCTEK